MTIENINGTVIISDIINNQYVKEKYVFYTKKESIRLFKDRYKNEYQLERNLNKFRKQLINE